MAIDLGEAIDKRVGEVRFDSIDLSFGEAVSLHTNKELVINPEYQRLFRWSTEQRSRIVESILLELPIPQIFVIENDDGVLELIDGLQRISSIIQFIDSEKLDLEPLKLEGCDLIPELNGLLYDDLPLKLKLQLKRSSVRTVIIKRQSKSFLRYEMFKRLNTGGTTLSHQEIRNCSARMVGRRGVEFYAFLQDLASDKHFKNAISSISDRDLEQKGDEELVLRFLSLKNFRSEFRGSVRDWLDGYMEKIILGKGKFDYASERREFEHLFQLIDKSLGDGAFVKYRGTQPIGSLAPAYFEAVSIGMLEASEHIEKKSPTAISGAVIKTVQSQKFRANTGPGANTKPKLNERILLVKQALMKI